MKGASGAWNRQDYAGPAPRGQSGVVLQTYVKATACSVSCSTRYDPALVSSGEASSGFAGEGRGERTADFARQGGIGGRQRRSNAVSAGCSAERFRDKFLENG